MEVSSEGRLGGRTGLQDVVFPGLGSTGAPSQTSVSVSGCAFASAVGTPFSALCSLASCFRDPEHREGRRPWGWARLKGGEHAPGAGPAWTVMHRALDLPGASVRPLLQAFYGTGKGPRPPEQRPPGRAPRQSSRPPWPHMSVRSACRGRAALSSQSGRAAPLQEADPALRSPRGR